MSDNNSDLEAVGLPTTEVDNSAVDDTTPEVIAADAADDELADTFPRSVVQKLRKEAADHRERTRDVESRLAAVQRQSVEQRITAAGMRPAAVWAVTQLDDLLAADGSIDTGKLAAAMAAARSTLGISTGRRTFAPDGDLLSGAGNGRQSISTKPRDSFATAFRRRPTDSD